MLFNLAFIAAWVDYIFFDADGVAAIISTFCEVFAGPLLVGCLLLLRGRRSGFRLLRFGAIPAAIFEPSTFKQLWELRDDPEFDAFLGVRTWTGNGRSRSGVKNRNWTESSVAIAPEETKSAGDTGGR
jgi:hypothetical protein